MLAKGTSFFLRIPSMFLRDASRVRTLAGRLARPSDRRACVSARLRHARVWARLACRPRSDDSRRRLGACARASRERPNGDGRRRAVPLPVSGQLLCSCHRLSHRWARDSRGCAHRRGTCVARRRDESLRTCTGPATSVRQRTSCHADDLSLTPATHLSRGTSSRSLEQ